MPTRISGKVYGDLTGSIFEPQVKSIANVDSGTLPVAHGGTGLNVPGASGSALVSDGTSLVYAIISGSGGSTTPVGPNGSIQFNSNGQFSGSEQLMFEPLNNGLVYYYDQENYVAIYPNDVSLVNNSVGANLNLLGNNLRLTNNGLNPRIVLEVSSSQKAIFDKANTSFYNDSVLVSGTLNVSGNLSIKDNLNVNGATFSGAVTASNGVSSSYYVLSNGYQLSSSEQFTQSINLNVYASKEEVTGAINQLTSSLSSSYVQNSTLNNYALISGVTFTGDVTASSGISSSLIRFPDGTELSSSTGLGGGLSSVYTDGNITGSGLIGDKIGLKNNITVDSITVNNLTTFGTVKENMFVTSSLTGSINFDTINQSLFYIKSLSGNITANFINVPTSSNDAITTTLILSQSATARNIDALQINSTSSAILWANGITPAGTANKHDIFSFSLINSGSSWIVFGVNNFYG